MEKQDVQLKGFEIVAYAGDARSKLLIALEKATKGEFEQVDVLLEDANKLIVQAHLSQTHMLQEEAKGNDVPYSFTMIHGQDHLMTAMLLKDMVTTLIILLKRTNTL